MYSQLGGQYSERSSQIFRLFEDPEGAGSLLFDILPPDAHLLIDFGNPPEHIKGTAIAKERRGKQLDVLFKVRLLGTDEPQPEYRQVPEGDLYAFIYVMADLEYEDDEVSKGLAVGNIESIFRGETDIQIAPEEWPVWVLPILFCPKCDKDDCEPQDGDKPKPAGPRRQTFAAPDDSAVYAFPTSKLIH